MRPILDAFRRGEWESRNVHLGYWASVEGDGVVPATMEEAKEALNQLVIGLSEMDDGLTVIDLGCGIGGSIEAVDKRFRDLTMFGVNLSKSQLTSCSSLRPSDGNRMRWVCSDAVRVGLRSGIADRVLSVEALPHFQSRRAFFYEVARLLRPTGGVVVTDVLLDLDAGAQFGEEPAAVVAALTDGFGVWPRPFDTEGDIRSFAGRAGLECRSFLDITEQVVQSLPRQRPNDEIAPDLDPFDRASRILSQLLQTGAARYVCAAFRPYT